MVLTACPKCRHEFQFPSSPLAPCPCRAALASRGVSTAEAASAAPAMLSLSITAASATSLSGGHVIVNTAAPTPRISVCATLPAPAPPLQSMMPAPLGAMPWSWTTPPSNLWTPSAPQSWNAPPPPTPSWAAVPPSPWCPPPPPTTLNLQICPSSAPVMHSPAPKGAQFRLSGGGIIEERGIINDAVLLQPRGKHGLLSCGPEQSPSTPLSFVLPASSPAVPTPLADPAPELDLQLLQATTRALKTSGWYYEGYSWQESAATLRNAAIGTFFVRDSSDPRFLFSLSVQTDRGPTSVRLHYILGGFRLDAEAHLVPSMPLFPCVLKLVEHYMSTSRKAKGREKQSGRGREQVWVDARGQMYSHILLTEPRRHTVPGLQHLARLAVHKQLRIASRGSQNVISQLDQLGLPTTIRTYLADYPYIV